MCSLKALLYRSLWGNRADLSLSCGKVEETQNHGAATDADHVLVDQSDEVVSCIHAAAKRRATAGEGGARIAIVLDNCGLEFVSDLALVDALLASGVACHVELHCKVGDWCPGACCDVAASPLTSWRLPHVRARV